MWTRSEGMPMSRTRAMSPARRRFLQGASVAAASLPAILASNDATAAPAAAAPAQPVAQAATGRPSAGYQFLDLNEAAFTQALVDHMWPRDQLSPSGSELGIDIFIDRQLVGAFGQGD